MSALRCALPALLLACRVTGTIGRDDPQGGGSGGGTGGSMEESGAATQGEVGGTAEGEGSGASTLADATTGSGSTAGSSESTAAIPHACIPTPDDSDCAQCRKTSCCEHLEACLAHEPCVCWWDCIQVDGHTAEDCATACGTDHELYEGLQTCTHDSCAACP